MPGFAGQNLRDIPTDHNETAPNIVLLNTAIWRAGGTMLPMARFSGDETRLTVRVILVHTLSYILPQRHFHADLEPVEVLTRRLRFLVVKYTLSTEHRVDVPESFPLEICAYVCLRFYEATFYTISFPDMVRRVWPATDFVKFGRKCLSSNRHLSG